MSAVAGVLRLDGGPAEVTAARALIDAMPDRGDDRGVWSEGPIALAWRTRRFDHPRGIAASVPHASRDGRLRLIYDGRLDNREAIARLVGAGREAADGDLFVEALAHAAPDLLPQLIGEFALAAWDARAHRLVLARDALGLRSLYWARQGDYLWWASELQAMLVVPWYTPRVSEGFVGELLADAPTDLEATVFAGIERLPQAHVLTADAHGVRAACYWEPPAAECTGLSDAEYAERLRDALTEAVRACLRGDPAAIGFHLSGGLDSSSVVALAHAIRPFDGPQKTYSLVYPGLPFADEREYIAAMAAQVGARSATVDPRGATRDEYLAHVYRYRDFPDVPNGEPLIGPTLRLARKDGVRVVLTGAGGDYWLAGNLFSLAMHARRGRWLRLLREMRHYRPDVPWSQLLAAAVLPNVPRRLKAVFRSRVDAWKRPPWICASFASRINLADRIRAGERRALAVASPVVRESVARFWSGALAYGNDRMSRAAEWGGVELRHPFLDRRVVEIVMALPDDQRAVRGLTKSVLRRAVGSLLPPLVRDRPGKADMGDLIPDAIEALDPDRWLVDLQVAAAGWVDAAVVGRILCDMRRARQRGPVENRNLSALWSVFGAEAWLRHERSLGAGAI
jgi:asparagine synthase (glutamine-hydrolysing)